MPLSRLGQIVSRMGLDWIRLAATLAGVCLLWFWIYLISQNQRPIFEIFGGCLLTLWALGQFALNLRNRWSREDQDKDRGEDHSADQAVAARLALAEALDQAPAGVILVEKDWKLSLVNKAAIELLKIPPALARPGVDGRDLLRFQLARGDLAADSLVNDIIKLPSTTMLTTAVINSQQAHPVFERKTPDGRTLEVRSRLLDDGRLIRTYTDVTPRIAALEATQAALLSRSRFLGSVSHELRTPLNAVIGFAHILLAEPLTPRQIEDVQAIADAGQQLLALVEDVLAVSSLDSAGLALNDASFDLPAALRRSLAAVERQAKAKALTLTLLLDEDLPEKVIGDEVRLCSALAKLLDNAVKFTEIGGVELRARLLSEDSSSYRIAISVSDSGPGIAAAELPGLFNPFTQGERSIKDRSGGIGGGLTLARLIVTAMGGEIGVACDPGRGCEFRIEVPLGRAASPSP